MKKLLTILSLLLALFVTACGPSYDTSSFEAFEASAMKQAKKEGFSEREGGLIMLTYILTMEKANKEEINKLAEGKTRQEIEMIIINKYVQGKTFKDIKAYIEKK